MTTTQHGKPWTQEDDGRLADLWARPDLTRAAVAKQLGRSIDSVAVHAWNLKLPPKAISGDGGHGFWNAERTATLRELHGRGDSGSEIAKALGITRNAAIGKAARLGLTCRPKPAKPARAPSTPRITVPRLAPRPPIALRVAENNQIFEPGAFRVGTPLKADTWAPLPGSQPQSFGDRPRTGCKWPINGSDGDLLACCLPATRNGHCAAHAEIGYRPAPSTANEMMRGLRRYA